MGTRRDILRTASFLFCVHLLAIIGMGEVVWNSAPYGALNVFTNHRAILKSMGSGAGPRNLGPSHGAAFRDDQPPSEQASLGCSDLSEEETHSTFNILNNTAPHILFALSGQNKNSSARMNTAGRPARLYLINSTLRC